MYISKCQINVPAEVHFKATYQIQLILQLSWPFLRPDLPSPHRLCWTRQMTPSWADLLQDKGKAGQDKAGVMAGKTGLMMSKAGLMVGKAGLMVGRTGLETDKIALTEPRVHWAGQEEGRLTQAPGEVGRASQVLLDAGGRPRNCMVDLVDKDLDLADMEVLDWQDVELDLEGKAPGQQGNGLDIERDVTALDLVEYRLDWHCWMLDSGGRELDLDQNRLDQGGKKLGMLYQEDKKLELVESVVLACLNQYFCPAQGRVSCSFLLF